MSSLETIDVRDLRPGMFVHLDLSWIAHPFPRGSFVISSEAQIETIRGLGLQRVRWDPARSQLPRPVKPAVQGRPAGHADETAAEPGPELPEPPGAAPAEPQAEAPPVAEDAAEA